MIFTVLAFVVINAHPTDHQSMTQKLSTPGAIDQLTHSVIGNTLSTNEKEAVEVMMQLAGTQSNAITGSNRLDLLPKDVLNDNMIRSLNFEDAINLKKNGISETDIINFCSKTDPENIVSYIFRDLDKADSGISDETRLANLDIFLRDQAVQSKIQFWTLCNG